MAAKRHAQRQFVVDDLQSFGDTFFAHGTHAIEHGAPNVHTLCAQRFGFKNVLSAANAAIHMHFNVFAHRIDDGRQGVDAGLGAIQLTTTMVGDDEGIRATLHRQASVFDVLNAFQNELAAPELFHPFHIGPIERRVELATGPFAQ